MSEWVCQICGGDAAEETVPLCSRCARVVAPTVPPVQSAVTETEEG
jgi:hypothetical protein